MYLKITPENLKSAYKKLKTHYFYYFGSLYLKPKIIKFEENLESNPKIFEEISKKFEAINLDSKENIKFGFMAYPKKDAFKNTRGLTTISDESIDYFIDVDIDIRLIDILFTINLQEALKDKISSECSYAGILDKRTLENNANNNFLFKNYRSQYNCWKNIPLKYCKEMKKTSDFKGFSIIRTDIKHCFNSVTFDFDKLLAAANMGNDRIAGIIKQLYLSYSHTKQLFPKDKDALKPNLSHLPIGLFSSHVILNYLLAPFDKAIQQNKSVLSYGRYVDDMIFIFNGKKASFAVW